MRQWRLMVDVPQSGAWNMATDEAILGAVSAKTQPPTLRLYRWSPFCLSLGYGQTLKDIDYKGLNANGWDVVRRPTGGKAILHGDELTYSLSLPIDHELAQGDVVESYRRISEPLLLALHHLGLTPQSEQQAKGNQGLGAVCFEMPSHYEITVGGKKLIGSAQVRRKLGILQHGTLPLWGDIARICSALYYANEVLRDVARQQVRERATTLESALGAPLAWDAVADAFCKGFQEVFAIELHPAHLTDVERAYAENLMQTTYQNPDWTHKR